MTRCNECGGMMDTAAKEILTSVGPYTVRDGSSFVLACDACGTVDMSMHEAALYELRAARTVLQDLPRIPGEVMRFARRAMGLRQEDLGTFLGLDRATVSRLETGESPITRQTQLAMLALVKVALDGPDALSDMKEPEPVDDGNELTVRPVRKAG
jgi:ribosome-binding protein aMBF1 (putative translation factor)